MSASAVLVTIAAARGSTPREAGASMTVAENSIEGTIGGGRLEFEAVELARRMLRERTGRTERVVPLGPEIGQCCGGRVDLVFERFDAALIETKRREEEAKRALWPAVYLFGAGHSGRALATALAPLPLDVTLVDQRRETLLDVPAGVGTVSAAMPESLVKEAPDHCAFVVMTHDHGLDFLIAAAALRRADAAYVGMIGSATKRARFKSYLHDIGQTSDIERLTLPIGGSALRDKRPEVIAALTAAELATCLFSYHQKNLPLRLA